MSEKNTRPLLWLLLIVVLRPPIGVIALEQLRAAGHHAIVLVVVQVEQRRQFRVYLFATVAADPLLVLTQPVPRHVPVDVRGKLLALVVLADVPPPGQPDQLPPVDL
eukprot:CAMPEP_0170193476 /NCGR_PEP_ID=MMETSP0040_2-20121228/56931_1 /TAXON_ID=641309 /ORGANISM="Lotharella oceanica, Strain CCMP622" /LENGTH=106 /DNA_ID=CAMNT_0010442113 /DNA_START=349 /DNA_END=665 /DNA_ORIENTATION=-